MALVTHRDPLVIGAALARWVEARGDARDVRVLNAEHPSIGYSSETVLVDLAGASDGSEYREDFVVRLAPPTVEHAQAEGEVVGLRRIGREAGWVPAAVVRTNS